MRAKLIETEHEEGGAVVLEVNGERLVAMDCLGYNAASYPEIGSDFEVEFRCLHSEGQDWNSLFGGNVEEAKRLDHKNVWAYRAFGQLVSVESEVTEAALADCGVCVLPVPVEVRDSKCIGEFVAFDVDRLDAWCKNDA